MALFPGCSGDADVGEACVPPIRMALANGILADGAAAAFTVRLFSEAQSCTGAAITSSVIVTAAHCFPRGHGHLVLSVRRGTSGEECLGTASAPCDPVEFAVSGSETADLVVLDARESLSGLSGVQFPFIHLEGPIPEFIGLGYGLGSYRTEPEGEPLPSSNGEHLIEGRFLTERSDGAFVVARGSEADGLVCSGDSGGPAVALVDGNIVLLGVLSDSDSESTSSCTPLNGQQFWTRLGESLSLLEAATGPCEKFALGVISVADCTFRRSRRLACKDGPA